VPAVESGRHPVTWLVTAWAWPLWRAVQATAAGPYTRRDAERWARCLARPQLDRLPDGARFGRLVARHPEFRSLLHYRLTPLPWGVRLLLRAVYRPLPSLHLNCAVIGDRVSIGAGAVVVGPVTVGDDASIGANATVVRDVPPGAVMLAPAAVAR
jgi:serine O-acetyltransferase